MSRMYAYALQIAGCSTIYGSHSTGPSLTYSLNASTPSYGFVGSCISTDSQLVFERTFAGNAAGVVSINDVEVTLLSKRLYGRDTATDPGRVFGRGGFDGMQWYAALAESVQRDAAAPTFDIVDPGTSVPSIVYIGREAMEVTYSNPTVTVVKRAVLGTPRLDHRRDPDRGDVPYLTPDPLSWRGARVNIWRAPVRNDGTLGTWIVRFRGDIADDPVDDAATITLRITPITDRLTQPLATDNRTLRLADEHTWADGVGTSVVVYAWAVDGELFSGRVAAQAATGSNSIELAALADGAAGITAHQNVSDVTNLPQGHPRTVPVMQGIFRAYEYDVTGYTSPDLDISPNVVGRDIEATGNDAGAQINNAPVGESVLLELVDTSGGPVTANGRDYLRAQFADTSQFGIGDREMDIAGVTRRTATWARLSMVENRGRTRWRLTSKVRPHRQFFIGLTNAFAAHDIASRYGMSERIEANCWVTGAQQDLETAIGGRSHDYPSPFLSQLVWSWYDPDTTEGMRSNLNGTRFGQRSVWPVEARPEGRAVALSHEGQSEYEDAAPIAARWYQAGETYITLDGATGVGASGRLVLEVRHGKSDRVVGKCIAIGETQLTSGAYRVELEVPASPDDDFALPTLVEGVPGALDRFTFTPAFVVENVDGGIGEVAMQLLTSGGGDDINSTYDDAPFGGQLIDGSGSYGDGDMGADIDVASILGIPTITGASISVVGRPSTDGRDGDSVMSLLAPHLYTANYVLDLVVDPNPTDPFDGCLLKARPVGRPTALEITGTIPASAIVERRRVPPPVVNSFQVASNFSEDGKPGIIIRTTFGTSVALYGERQAKALEMMGVEFLTVDAATIALRPSLTRLVEKAFPQPRYELTVSTDTVRALGVSYGSAVYVTDALAPQADGTLGVSSLACRVVEVSLAEGDGVSTVTVESYGVVARGRAPCVAVIDYIDASTVKVADNFFAETVDPVTGATVKDMDLLLNPTYGSGLGVGTKIVIRQVGDVDTTRRMQVASYDVSTGQIEVEDDPAEAVYGDAHGIPDPGAEQSPEDYIAVIETRETATAPAGHLAYFHHGRDIVA